MNEPIRGRWTLRGAAATLADGAPAVVTAIDGPWVPCGDSVDVVPVPDEQDIERAAKALARRYGEEVGFADWLGIARTVVSALEPPE